MNRVIGQNEQFLAPPFVVDGAVTQLAGCDVGTDAATRLAHDIETGASRLEARDGSEYSIEHRTPSRSGECEGPYAVQLDKVGALIIWCKDAGGTTLNDSRGEL